MTHPIYACLWFEDQAREAADFYCSIFKNSKIISDNPMVTMFEINSAKFMALNGGPKSNFTEAVSFVVNCDTQEEIDFYWDKLTEGGEESMCGWLKDKFGVSWQIIPTVLDSLMSDPEKAGKAAKAFLAMRKLDIEQIVQATLV